LKSSKATLDSLIQQCKNEDRKAQREIYELFSPAILGVIYRYIPDYDMANEVLQLTFIKMFKQIDTYNGDNFKGWLCKIAINTALNVLKQNKKYQQMQDVNDVDSSEKLIVAASALDDSADILRIITALPTEERTLFNLRAIDGYSFKEVAQKLNLSEANSRVKYHRIRTKLAGVLKQLF
jgi:RNA polymerase sigma-70 factor (ECF subfamily)